MDKIYRWLVNIPALYKIGILAAGIGIIIGIYYTQYYSPAMEKLAKSEKNLKLSYITLKESERQLKEARKAKKEFRDIENKSESLNQRIPANVDLLELVGELDHMSDEVTIIRIKPMEEDTSSYSSVVIKPIQFELEGRFHSILRFLYKMFQMDRLMDIGDISLELKIASGNKENLKPYTLKATIIARIYYSPFNKIQKEKAKSKKKNLIKSGVKRLISGPMVPERF